MIVLSRTVDQVIPRMQVMRCTFLPCLSVINIGEQRYSECLDAICDSLGIKKKIKKTIRHDRLILKKLMTCTSFKKKKKKEVLSCIISKDLTALAINEP